MVSGRGYQHLHVGPSPQGNHHGLRLGMCGVQPTTGFGRCALHEICAVFGDECSAGNRPSGCKKRRARRAHDTPRAASASPVRINGWARAEPAGRGCRDGHLAAARPHSGGALIAGAALPLLSYPPRRAESTAKRTESGETGQGRQVEGLWDSGPRTSASRDRSWQARTLTAGYPSSRGPGRSCA
jgi:hypothetical protein